MRNYKPKLHCYLFLSLPLGLPAELFISSNSCRILPFHLAGLPGALLVGQGYYSSNKLSQLLFFWECFNFPLTQEAQVQQVQDSIACKSGFFFSVLALRISTHNFTEDHLYGTNHLSCYFQDFFCLLSIWLQCSLVQVCLHAFFLKFALFIEFLRSIKFEVFRFYFFTILFGSFFLFLFFFFQNSPCPHIGPFDDVPQAHRFCLLFSSWFSAFLKWPQPLLSVQLCL